MRPDGKTLYMLSGGRDRSDWVKNMIRNPDVEVRISGNTFGARGRIITDAEEDLQARKLIIAKYYGREYDPSGGWEATSLPVAVGLKT
jgi:hypothetical protein